MIVKVYGILWAALAAVVAIAAVTGNITDMTIVVFGLIAFGMIFMGMIGVLPTVISHPPMAKVQEPKVVNTKRKKGLVHTGQLSHR